MNLGLANIANNDTVDAGLLCEFQKDGYIVIRGLYTSEEAAQIRDTFMKEAQGGPVPGLSEISRGGIRYDPSDPLSYYPRMMNPHRHTHLAVGKIALDFLLNPRLQPILTALLGEEPLGVQTMFYFKPAGARGQALHQDNFYLRVSPGTCIAAWLAVDDADEDNGGMVVVPGTNLMKIVCPEKADPSKFFTAELVNTPEGLSEVPVRLQAGDILFFNGSLIHGSYSNASKDRFRRSLIAHYVPRYSHEVWEGYHAIDFSGNPIAIAPAVGGGPCGTLQPGGIH